METRTDNYKEAIKSFIKQGKVEEAMEAVDALATHALHVGMQCTENCNQNKSDSDNMVVRQKEDTMQEEFDKQHSQKSMGVKVVEMMTWLLDQAYNSHYDQEVKMNTLAFLYKAKVPVIKKGTCICELMYLGNILRQWFRDNKIDTNHLPYGYGEMLKVEKELASDFNNILQEMQELHDKKNHDYGNSFSETIQEFGFTPAIARINDKLKRLKQMVKGEPMQIKESMRDNLLDIANYCILTIIELDNQNK